MRGFMKLSWVEIKLFAREPITVIFTLAFPFIMLFVMAGVFGNEPDTDDNGGIVWRGVGPTDYYVPAYIGLVMAAIGLIAVPVHLAAYRERGVLRRLRASSISLWAILGSQVVVAAATATVGGLLLTAMALLVYDVALPEAPAQLLLAFCLSVLCFSAVGLFLGALLPTTRAAQAAGLLLYFPIMMISGAGPPREVMTRAMQGLGDVMPLRYVILLLQDPWLGFGWDGVAYAIVVGVMVVAAVTSVRLFRWE